MKNPFRALSIPSPIVSRELVGTRPEVTRLRNRQAHDVPLDFFSWHLYSNEPEDHAAAARFYREQLDAHGYTATASHITEWNTGIENVSQHKAVALRTDARGAAILTAAWIALQEEGVEESYFYRGNDTSPEQPTFYGLFLTDGRSKKSALAFDLWQRCSRHPQRLALTVTPAESGVWALAGQTAQGVSSIHAGERARGWGSVT